MLAAGIGVLLALTLTVEPAKKEIALGEAVELNVTVKGEGMGLAPVLDSRSITLSIGEGAGQFVYQRKLETPPDTVDLSKGQAATISWTPVRAGRYPIEVVYAGKASAETEVAVAPGKGGETEVGMVMKTALGEMKLRFFPEVAPNHASHFAERARTGFYDGLGFHRIIDSFMAQGGDPKGDGTGGVGYTLPQEFSRDKRWSHTFGRLSTARLGHDVNSGGCQFFICFDGAAQLDGGYTVLGEVFEGKETVRALEKASVPGGMLPKEKHVKIEKVSLVPIKAGK